MIAPNRLSISNYPPYPGWENFCSSIERAYAAYRLIAVPSSIERIGLRYINLINFGINAISQADFFNYYPNIGNSCLRTTKMSGCRLNLPTRSLET